MSDTKQEPNKKNPQKTHNGSISLLEDSYRSESPPRITNRPESPKTISNQSPKSTSKPKLLKSASTKTSLKKLIEERQKQKSPNYSPPWLSKRSSSAPNLGESLTPPDIKRLTQKFDKTMRTSSQGKIDLSALGIGDMDDENQISLENFDERNPNIKITSPRSIAACMRTGIFPNELIYKEESEFRDGNVSDVIVKMRFEHYEKKRQEKLKLVRNERLVIMNEEKNRKVEEGDSIGAIDREKERVKKIMENNRKHLEHLAFKEMRVKKELLKKQREAEEQRRKDELERLEKEKEMKRRQKELIRKRKEFQRQLELRMEEERQKMIAKQLEMEEKEKKQKINMFKKKLKKQAELEAKKRSKEIAIETAKQEQQKMERLRRELYNEKLKKVEQRRRQYEQYREKEREYLQLKALTKQQRIERTRERNARIERQRIQNALKKQQRVEERKKKLEHLKQYEILKKKAQEELKEQKRIEKLEKAKQYQMERVSNLVMKQALAEQAQRKLLEEKRRAWEIKNEEMRLKELDRKENVERMRRIQQFKALQTLEKIEEKKRKAELIEQEKQNLIEKRMKERIAIEKSKRLLKSLEPGRLGFK